MESQTPLQTGLMDIPTTGDVSATSLSVFQRQLDHLVRMARIPGFKAHAWCRALELSTSAPFIGIDEALKEAMREQAKTLEA
jgi:hypothetical protein